MSSNIRPMKLPDDFDIWLDITQEGFTYPDHPEWNLQADEVEGTMDSIQTLKRFWPLFRLLQMISADLRDALHGFFYEADGEIAGNISYQRQRGGQEWYIGDVVVLPKFRGKGIARQLVDATLVAIRKRQGKKVFLDVIDGNIPAYNLYKKVGFEDFSGVVHFSCDTSPSLLAVPDGYHITTLAEKDWRTRYTFEQRITPDHVSKYTPVTESRFRRSLLIRAVYGVLRRLLGEKYAYFALRDGTSQQVVGIAWYEARTRPGGVNKINAQLDLAQPAIATFLLSYALSAVREASHGQRVEFTLPTWQPILIEAAEGLGAQRRYTTHRMGIILPVAGN